MHTYYIWTIGCQMNVSDSHRLAETLEDLGYEQSPRMEEADIMVLNTCVVRQSAETKVIGRLNSLKSVKKQRPDAQLIVMGCFVGQSDERERVKKEYPFVDLFMGPSEIGPIVEFIKHNRSVQDPGNTETTPRRSPVCGYTTIIHGCNNYCSYCIVPYRRGPEASRPISDIITEVSGMVRTGTREITLLGQNVDSYGHDLPDHPSLSDLLQAVHDIDNLWRIRFLTSHPKDMTKELIQTVARLPKICEHIELPFQAGDDDILRRMNRHYTIAHYRELIQQIREAMPDVGIATDVIVGFPGETEDQFDRTYALLEETRFDAVHVASYSTRTGTAAAQLEDNIETTEKERRRKSVDELQKRIVAEINAQFLNETLEVLVETRHKGKWRGRTRTNKLVFFSDPRNWQSRLARVRITWTGPWSMQGVIDN